MLGVRRHTATFRLGFSFPFLCCFVTFGQRFSAFTVRKVTSTLQYVSQYVGKVSHEVHEGKAGVNLHRYPGKYFQRSNSSSDDCDPGTGTGKGTCRKKGGGGGIFATGPQSGADWDKKIGPGILDQTGPRHSMTHTFWSFECVYQLCNSLKPRTLRHATS